MIRSLELSKSQEEKGVGNLIDNGVWLYDEACSKMPKQRGFINISTCLEAAPPSSTNRAPVVATLPDLALCTSPPGDSSVSFIINQYIQSNVFLSSVSPYCKLPNPRRWLWEPPIYSQLVRNFQWYPKWEQSVGLSM